MCSTLLIFLLLFGIGCASQDIYHLFCTEHFGSNYDKKICNPEYDHYIAKKKLRLKPIRKNLNSKMLRI